jgi:hypothetical protein
MGGVEGVFFTEAGPFYLPHTLTCDNEVWRVA